MTTLSAGKLNRRISLQRRATQSGAPGGVALGPWAEIGKRWAAVMPMGGRQVQEHALSSESADIKICVRSCSLTRSLTTDDRIELNGRVFGIVYVEPASTQDSFVWFQCDSRREN